MSREKRYDKVLRELNSEYQLLLESYVIKLHTACHEDRGLKLSHTDIVSKIKDDCLHIFSDGIGRIAFDDRSEEEVIKEILEYNYDMADIKHMKEVERLDLFPVVNQLNEHCVKRTEAEWVQFGIHELMQNGKVAPGEVGSKRTQFCKCCGEQIYISTEPGSHQKA